ncbi:MAG: lamin tail domain-containing protein [Bacteroidales bacterium]|nr:lamin tail domain-containing protein [Bacteroidales bacterium]
MRKVLLLFLLVPGMVCAQVVYEDFESGLQGDWLLTGEDRWETDSSFSINGKFSLHHSFDNSDSGCDQVGIGIGGLQPALSATEWKFKIRHAYNPSSSNNWSFFLLSDEAPPGMLPGGTASGYALGVNFSGYDDTLRLWKLTEGSSSVVLSTSLNWQNDIGIDSVAALTVKRNTDGQWQVFIADRHHSQVLIGEGTDSDLFYAGWAGIMYEYSSSQDRKLWIDDVIIEGHLEVDRQPPLVDTAYFSGRQSLILKFNESLADPPARQGCTLMPGNMNPDEIIQEGDSYLLAFGQPLANKTYYDLHISNVCDMWTNCCDTVIDSIALAIPGRKDIIISEIMFDPEPPAGLPEAEYIELYNTSGFDLNISGLKVIIGTDEYLLPEFRFEQDSHLLLTNEIDAGLFKACGTTISPDRRFSLNNTIDMILLRDKEGEFLHGLEYDIKWYKNQLKQYGGWALEMIDYDYPFAGRSNWTESKDRSGGTPGRLNSVNSFNPDLEKPVLINIYPVSHRHVHLAFSETMDREALDPQGWSVQENGTTAVESTDPLERSIEIELADSLEKGIIYEISSMVEIKDMAGNSLVMNDKRFGIPVVTETGDILFNEIMFDPLPGGAEFIELYNNSGKIVDMSDLFIVTYDAEKSDTGTVCWLSGECRCLMPGDYYVITDDREAIFNQFTACDENRVFELASLPSLPDKEGNLLLYNRNLILIDRMYYSGEMHSAMLSVTGGISLERVSTDIPAMDRTNWRSAPGSSGYATPGIENSSAGSPEDLESKGAMSLSSRKISPDNDGYEDYLRILVSSGSDRNIISVQVFNDMGYLVRTLADNLATGSDSVLIWDGCDDRGNPLREGIYIICSTIMPTGSPPLMVKKVCALVYY